MSTGLDTNNSKTTRKAAAAAEPVTFAGTIGLYAPASQAARKSTAVLFVSPWGFEEMCTRKFFRMLAEELAEAGVASLRFDYAGTGDALEVTDHSRGLAVWLETAEQAAAQLKSLSGCDSIILVSQKSRQHDRCRSGAKARWCRGHCIVGARNLRPALSA